MSSLQLHRSAAGAWARRPPRAQVSRSHAAGRRCGAKLGRQLSTARRIVCFLAAPIDDRSQVAPHDSPHSQQRWRELVRLRALINLGPAPDTTLAAPLTVRSLGCCLRHLTTLTLTLDAVALSHLSASVLDALDLMQQVGHVACRCHCAAPRPPPRLRVRRQGQASLRRWSMHGRV